MSHVGLPSGELVKNIVQDGCHFCSAQSFQGFSVASRLRDLGSVKNLGTEQSRRESMRLVPLARFASGDGARGLRPTALQSSLVEQESAEGRERMTGR